MEEVSFRQVVSRGCGIDVHQKVVVATIGGGSTSNSDPRVWYYDKFFDRIERVVIRQRNNACCHGKHRSLLETCL